jgi:hypothetical protein
MPLIIDAYNVLHTTGVLPPEIAGLDARGLSALVRAGRFRHERTTIVCDGVPGEDSPTGREGPVVFRYSGGGATADDVIARMIRRSSIPRKLTIVSSDRAVLREARKRRCNTLTSEEFLRRLAEDHEQADSRQRRRRGPAAPPTPLPDEEVDQWLEEFDIGDAEFLPEPVEPDRVEAPPEPEAAKPPPRAPTVFSADLLAEAEAMIEEAIVEEEKEPEVEAVPEPIEDEVAADPEPEKAKPPAVDPLRAVLPDGMLEEAEAIVAESAATDRAEAEAAAAAAMQEDEPAPAPEPIDPLRAMLPEDLIAQAEAIEEASRSEPPKPPPRETADEPEVAPPQHVEHILPADILAEAEAMLAEDEDEPPDEEEDR